MQLTLVLLMLFPMMLSAIDPEQKVLPTPVMRVVEPATVDRTPPEATLSVRRNRCGGLCPDDRQPLKDAVNRAFARNLH